MHPLGGDHLLGLLADLPEFNFAVEASCQKEVAVNGRAKAGDTGRNQPAVPTLHLYPTDL